MTTVGYLLDENADPHLARAMRERWPGMVVTQMGQTDAPPLGSADPVILEWCETRSLSLVTYDRRSMPGHLMNHLATGRHVPGIFILDHQRSMGESMERLALIWGASDAEEYMGQIVYLFEIV